VAAAHAQHDLYQPLGLEGARKLGVDLIDRRRPAGAAELPGPSTKYTKRLTTSLAKPVEAVQG
jgi:hypothetical protein